LIVIEGLVLIFAVRFIERIHLYAVGVAISVYYVAFRKVVLYTEHALLRIQVLHTIVLLQAMVQLDQRQRVESPSRGHK